MKALVNPCGEDELKDFTQGSDMRTFTNTCTYTCLHLTLVTKQYHLFYISISQYLCSLYDLKCFLLFVVCLFSVLD